jgi:hypothetical protein
MASKDKKRTFAGAGFWHDLAKQFGLAHSRDAKKKPYSVYEDPEVWELLTRSSDPTPTFQENVQPDDVSMALENDIVVSAPLRLKGASL